MKFSATKGSLNVELRDLGTVVYFHERFNLIRFHLFGQWYDAVMWGGVLGVKSPCADAEIELKILPNQNFESGLVFGCDILYSAE